MLKYKNIKLLRNKYNFCVLNREVMDITSDISSFIVASLGRFY